MAASSSGGGWILTSPGGIDLAPLPTTGTYVIQIDPDSNYTGALAFLLSEEIVGSIVPGGSAVSVSITRAGQRARLTFTGTANQRVSIMKTTGVTIAQTSVSIIRPDGSSQSSLSTGANSTAFMDPTTLASSGTYAVLVDPGAVYTGDITLILVASICQRVGCSRATAYRAVGDALSAHKIQDGEKSEA